MTSISMIAPYAPQPAVWSGPEALANSAQIMQPLVRTASSGGAGTASDQSGAGAGNGTGTGGALTETLLRRSRDITRPAGATSRSVVEAQSKSDETAAFLADQQARKIEARIEADARLDAAERSRETQEKAEADAALKAETFEMPNPLPTAPILQDD